MGGGGGGSVGAGLSREGRAPGCCPQGGAGMGARAGRPGRKGEPLALDGWCSGEGSGFVCRGGATDGCTLGGFQGQAPANGGPSVLVLSLRTAGIGCGDSVPPGLIVGRGDVGGGARGVWCGAWGVG